MPHNLELFTWKNIFETLLYLIHDIWDKTHGVAWKGKAHACEGETDMNNTPEYLEPAVINIEGLASKH